jgi:hypothetical protein
MEKPKPRRKNYRYFQNFDIIKFKERWFVRFPNEREYVFFGKKRAELFFKRMSDIIRDNHPVPFYVDDIQAPILTHIPPMDTRDIAVRLAKYLLRDGYQVNSSGYRTMQFGQK